MDFNQLVKDDIDDIFLKEFSQTAIFKSSTTLKEITVQFFEESLDKMDSTFFHAWCKYEDAVGIAKNNTLEIDGTVYGIVDFAPDEFQDGMNLFLQEV